MKSGYHMKACCAEIPGIMKIVREGTGNATSLQGISAEMLDCMIRAYHFTYECVNLNIPTLENTSTTIGSIHYATHDACDVIVAPTVLRYDRFQLLDFIHPWLIEPVRMLIPMPVFVSDSSAFTKPFALTVWMGLLSSVFLMIVVLVLLDFFKGAPGSIRSKINLDWLFVIGSLFGKGGFKISNKTKIRIMATVWLFGTFVLAGLYTSQLFGYLMTNIPEPIVKSAEELADKPNVDLLVVDHLAVDITISRSDDPLMKKLAKKIDQNPKKSRCSSVPACMEKVKDKNQKNPSVFLHGIGPISNVMMNDYRKTGQCNFALAKKSFSNVLFPGSWMVRKGDQNTETYNMATLRMNEAGLLNHWQDVYQPKPYNCLEKSKQKEDDPRSTAKISLANLTIPFAMLSIGFLLALVILIFEKWMATCGFKKKPNRATAAWQ